MVPPEYVSTAEAARKAGVAVSSVKRWADDGVLPCSRTAGGHRRFLLRDLEQFLATQSAREREGATALSEHWLHALLEPDAHTLLGSLFLARGRLGAWHRVADELGAALVHLGEQWENGAVSVLDEHLASERLHRALAQIAEGLTCAPTAPACLLATAEEDAHTLGLSLLEVCLREAGLRTLWIGRTTPFGELARRVKQGPIQLVALSASEFSKDRARLTAQLAPLVRACRAKHVPILLGGRGRWPEDLRGAMRLTSFSELQPALAELQMGASR